MHALFHLCRGILHGVPIPLLLTLLCSLATVTAATFTVTTEADSGAGTLRQAITEANATGGADTIEFNIPGGGVRTIALTSQLPNITDPVTINGYTQPGASQNTQAAGNDAVLTVRLDGTNAGGGVGLHITVGSSTVRGLVITNWSTGIQLSTLGGNTIAGNFLGTDATGNTAAPNTRGIFMFASNSNQIGGTTPAARNLISGNEFGIDTFTSSNNIIEGNFIGTNKAGTAALPVANSNARGINLAAVCDNNSVGGTAAGARNIISGLTGIPVSMQGTVGNRVEGNYIGTDVSGDVAIGNGFGNNASCAVCIVGNRNPLGSGGGPASDNRVGGTAAGAGNVIAAFTAIQGGAAIFVGGSSVGDSRRANSNIIQGNFIGTNKNGTIAFANPSSHGVHIQDGDDNIVGGTAASAANIIANNRAQNSSTGGIGVQVTAGVRNQILGNSIYNNDRLGIDLVSGGNDVTPNDTGDADTGPNNLQNFPIITGVTLSGGNTNITGTLNSTASVTFRLEFFSNTSAHSTGYGEGQTFLGTTNVTTDGSGNASFNVSFPVAANAKTFTATATDPNNNTSEFSPAFRVRLLNISTRMRVLTEDRVLIGGFIITGADPKRVIVRGIGPSLQASGISNALVDPVLELNAPGTTTTNDNWRDTQQAEIQAAGFAPSSNAESAIIATLQPGAYTAILREKNSTPGVGLVEVYDLDQTAGSKLANISTRGFVDTGDNVMIGGFIIGPANVGAVRVVIRAIGPTLANSNVQGALNDPTLEAVDANGNTIAMNDNWKDTQQADIIATGLAPTNDFESAIVATLNAGAYTTIVRGKNDTTGVGLVEVYNID